VNTVVEPEFNRMLPEGLSVHAARMHNARSDLEDTLRMNRHAERAADELASAKVDVIAYACTAGSFVRGESGEKELRQRIEMATGIPVVTTAGAVAEALSALAVTRLVMATPYTDDINMLEKAFLEASGFEVVDMEGLGIVDAFSIGAVAVHETYRLVRTLRESRVTRPGSSVATFVSCTNLPTAEIIGSLERDTGAPVVTSNQATLWACLRAVGCRDAIPGYGALLENVHMPLDRSAADPSCGSGEQ
jgi:maleate isomerase